MPDLGPSDSAPFSTLEEMLGRPVRSSALLTYVLGYDDLLADNTRSLQLDDGTPELTIGRDRVKTTMDYRTSEKLGLRDRWCSSQHACLRRTDAGFVVSDLGSRNGTYVNGIRIREQRLWSGDVIEVGHTLLCYREADADIAPVLVNAPPLLGPTPTRSPELARLVQDIERIAPSNQPVLLLGETGAGKDIVAGAIHARSGRQGQLVAVDCGAVPATLFESTFFGHQRGAFTGAGEARVGEMMRADGGTLFLDEVANMGLPQQAKLLRVLEDGKVTPLGASSSKQLDVRWIAATNHDVFANDSGFRQDLLQRLAGYVARLPPLRRRREDLGVLTAYILRDAGCREASITAPAGRRLYTDPFAGNVRQLRTALRSAALLAGGAPIDVAQLSQQEPAVAPVFSATTDKPTGKAAKHAPKLQPARSAVDAAQVKEALLSCSGNVVQAARALQTHPRQVYRWIDRFSIELDVYRR